MPAAKSRCGSGAATPTGGEFQEYQTTVEEGMVVLDVIHRIQATQAPDLAVRWNCKAGQCGSCSAEVNGKPRLMCMTRMNTFAPGETITVAPMKTFPLIRDLVTDVSSNFEKAKTRAGLQARPEGGRRHAPHVPGGRRPGAGVPQVHRVLPVPERLPRHPRPRRQQGGLRRPAPVRAAGGAGDAPARHQRPPRADQAARRAGPTATSPSAAPRSAPSTSTSPTTRSSRSRSASSPSTTTRSPGSGAG